jgi:tetraacyldisaccharide 4'-kinase
VIGNVVVGGAGKTPLTIALAQSLMARGEHPGVVSKGYGRNNRHALIDVLPHSSPQDTGDEPVVIAQALNCPVVVCSDRSQGIVHLLAQHPETTVVLCDDGLQDATLHRDVEVVAFDERGVGNGWLLPAGPLREPWPRTPARHVTSLLIQGSVWGQTLAPLPGECSPQWQVWRQLGETVQRLDTQAQQSLTRWQGQPVQALAGIAKPAAFIQMLQDAGLDVARQVIRPDHDALVGVADELEPGLPVFTTAKDAVKLRAQLAPEWAAKTWVVGLSLTLPESLISALAQAVAQRQSELSSRYG